VKDEVYGNTRSSKQGEVAGLSLIGAVRATRNPLLGFSPEATRRSSNAETALVEDNPYADLWNWKGGRRIRMR